MIFSDFYSSIAWYRNDAASADASTAVTMLELQDASLKSCDSAQRGLADQLRALMSLSFHFFLIDPTDFTQSLGWYW
jgi:hypothetical protein